MIGDSPLRQGISTLCVLRRARGYGLWFRWSHAVVSGDVVLLLGSSFDRRLML